MYHFWGPKNGPILGPKSGPQIQAIWPKMPTVWPPNLIIFGSKLTLPVVFLQGSSLRDKRWFFVCNDQLATCSAIEKLAGHKPSITDIINITTFV